MATEDEIAGQHLAIYESFYNELNPLQVPSVDAETVANFLKRSGLGIFQLSQIWEISDRLKKGSLDKVGIFTSFKLVAAVQQDRLLSSAILIDESIQPPKFETPSTQPTSFSTSSPIYNKSPVSLPSTCDADRVSYRTQRSASISSKSSMIDDFGINSEEQAKYETIFYSLKPVNGKLSGEQCKSVLLNSHLPQVQLARIWELADLDRDGHLDKYEMFIALHLVCRCLHGEILPKHLPISLIHPMKRVQCSMAGVKNTKIRSGSITSLPTSSYTPISDSSIFQHDAAATWPIDVNLYREVFQKLDTDADGFVTGMDVKTCAMKFNILQPVLAHIWTLVDVAKAGRLNLEQFALWSEIMKEAQSNMSLPEHLPQHLLPPTMRNFLGHSSNKKRNSMGNISANSNSGSTIGTKLEENEKIIELNKEIEKAVENRRKAEQDLFQLEADTLVKNSEIKNLELELQTLTTTVIQLEHQKIEANKRLLELDNKIEKLESMCKEQNERIASEEERLQRVKAEIAQAIDNYTTESETMQALQAELVKTDQKLEKSKQLITDEDQKMERFVDKLTIMERQNDAYIFEIDRIEKLTVELAELMKKCKSSDNEDNFIQMDNDILNSQFQHITLSLNIFPNANNKVMPKFNDIFKDDPFDSSETIKGKYSFSDDPFASSTANVQFANELQFADFSKFTVFGS